MNRSELEKKRQYWSKIVEEWASSGESKANFCRERNLRAWQLSYWYGRLKSDESDSVVGFVRLHGKIEVSGIRLRTTEGLEFELVPGFDKPTLKRFLSVLTSPC